MGNRTQVNEFDIVGRVVFVGMPTFITNRFSKRMLIMEVYAKGKYKSEVPFQFVNDNMGLLDKVRVNDWVHVAFMLRSRDFINKQGKKEWYAINEGTACQLVD